jgi:hypothetical protein
MDPGRDPLDDLARAFRDWPAPAATRDLPDEDEATRGTVAWMAAALRAQAPSPAAAAPPRAPWRRAPAPARWRLRDWRPLAAAAVLLLLLGGPLLLVTDRGPRPAPPLADAGPAVPQPAPDGPAAPLPPEPVMATEPGLVVAVDRQRIELRSGPVHLLLLTRSRPDPTEEPR